MKRGVACFPSLVQRIGRISPLGHEGEVRQKPVHARGNDRDPAGDIGGLVARCIPLLEVARSNLVTVKWFGET
jgi:hypothetical protein